MEFLKKWNSISLVKRIICGLLAGTMLGLVLPQATTISLLGDLFVGALKALAPLLVFFLVMHSLLRHKQGTSSNMKMITVLYLVSTFAASFSAVLASFLFPSTLLLVVGAQAAAPSGIYEVIRTLLVSAVSNPIGAIVNANYIGILMWSIVFGLILRNSSEATKSILGDLANMMTSAIRLVINCAPFGIMGLVFTTVSQTGLQSFVSYVHIILVLVGCMVFVALIVNPLIVFLCARQNPYPLIFTCLKESGVVAFFTRSSAANIPVNLALCERLGLRKDQYSISIPLGATINMAGAAITIAILTLAAANTLAINVDFPTAFLLSLVATIAACGASGVAGGSLLLIPLACSMFGISNDIAMQVVGIGFIIGIIQDSCETALNSSSDVVFTATAELSSRK